MRGRDASASILRALRAADGFVSGENLSHELGVSRTAVWKHVKNLRDEGYGIDSRPNLGYRLQSEPDLLRPEEVLAVLTTRSFGRRMHYVRQTVSTNDLAREMALAGAPEGSIAVAEEQKSGRGRLARAWSSPKGGIWFSIVLRPKLPPSDLPKIMLASSVAVAEALKSLGAESSIKWPNDVLIGGKKVAGILSEMTSEPDRMDFVIVGIGINANASLSDFPHPLRSRITTLARELGGPIERNEFLAAVLARFELWYGKLIRGEWTDVGRRWKEMSQTIGSRVAITTVAGTVKGKAVDLDSHGALVVETQTGVVTVSSGDVQELRSG